VRERGDRRRVAGERAHGGAGGERVLDDAAAGAPGGAEHREGRPAAGAAR
jgi:hypothetical protein